MIGHRFVKTGIVLSLLTVATARPATAEVITILRGTFVSDRGEWGGSLDIEGNRGFTLEADALLGFFGAFNACSVPECPPGTVVEINAGWSGNDLPGTATLRGKTYPDVGGHSTWNSAFIRFSGQITMPPMAEGPVSITAPFDFAGRFTYSPDLSSPSEALLTGGGVVTFLLEPYPDGTNTSWIVRRAEFDFRPVKR
jgi:hypothetical protein